MARVAKKNPEEIAHTAMKVKTNIIVRFLNVRFPNVRFPNVRFPNGFLTCSRAYF